MAIQPQPGPPPVRRVTRTYEQPADAISLYSDFAQILGTEQEVMLQFYETIPGPPSSEGQVQSVVTRLRATITVSKQHALTIGRLLQEKTGGGDHGP